MINQARMLAQLELHEGLRLEVYTDTEGNDTLGIGYNITGRTIEDFEATVKREIHLGLKPCITVAEARLQCAADARRVERAVIAHFPFYMQLSEVRQRVVVDLAFNIGFHALAFKQTRAAIEAQDWSRAYRELYKSKWAYQVDDGPGGHFGRADRLGKMLLTNIDYTA